MAYETRVHNPGSLVVVLVLASAFLHVKISVKLVRIYIAMVTCFRARLCWGGGGNVTLNVYRIPRVNRGVCAAFWTTLGYGVIWLS